MTPGVHGGPDAAGVPCHDFSTNSNACGPCPAALQALQAADATRYPDPAYTTLRERLALLHGVVPQRIVLAASASEFIHRITALAALRGAGAGSGAVQVALPAHSYGDYAQAAAARGLALLRGTAPGADRAGLQWACEPSSPQGLADPALAAWTAHEVLGDGPTAPAPLRVLDCAYGPLRLDGDAPWTQRLAPLQGHVWQLWTPNKALGLTGVRAAYAVAPAGSGELVEHLAALAPSWPVGAHGVALLQSWTEGPVQQWLAQSLTTLRDWKRRQHVLCSDLGWKVQPCSLANYFCATPQGLEAGADLSALLAALRTAGIKLRDCASFGLHGQVRLGVLPPASQDALRAAVHALGRPFLVTETTP